jgi:uncharacterized protein YbjT (DUF2867 family)
MRIAITGGNGFIGAHLAARLSCEGHKLVMLDRTARRPNVEVDTKLVKFVKSDLSDEAVLEQAFTGCEAVAHCAGINRELGAQTYRRVHVEATKRVVNAARRAGVKRIVLMSFLRARPNCGSPYHESKWSAEEIVRNSGLDYTIIRSGMVYGRGDHMLDHLSHALYTLPVFAMVGLEEEKSIRPLAVEDLVTVLRSAVLTKRLAQKTVAITGAEELRLSEAVKRVANVLGIRVTMFRLPVWTHYLFASFWELTMKTPLVARAQVRILSEGVTEPALPCDPLPYDLSPTRKFTNDQIRKGLPDPGPFTLGDLRFCA